MPTRIFDLLILIEYSLEPDLLNSQFSEELMILIQVFNVSSKSYSSYMRVNPT